VIAKLFDPPPVHGDRLQEQREEAVNDFKHGRMPILVRPNPTVSGQSYDHESQRRRCENLQRNYVPNSVPRFLD
jgi:hypothetical protein